MILSIILGLGLAATTGLRVFMPLLVLSLFSYFDIGNIPLSESFAWLGSIEALIILSVAATVEVLAYYVPFVDNLLDTIAVPMATICGTIVAVSVMGDIEPAMRWTLAIVAGGGLAGFVKGNNAGFRLFGNAATGGLSSPVISTGETLAAIFFSVVGWFAPLVFLLLIVGVLILLFVFLKKFMQKKEKN